jgi:hypothetical protein
MAGRDLCQGALEERRPAITGQAGINTRRTQRIRTKRKRAIYKSKLKFLELPAGNIDRLTGDICRLIRSQKGHQISLKVSDSYFLSTRSQ